MAEEKKNSVEMIDGVTTEEAQLFKHGTHCDTMEELFSSIEENYKKHSLTSKDSTCSQWKRAVKTYEKELYDSIFGMTEKDLIRAFAFADYDEIKKHLINLLLNGAKSWEQFSQGGSSLCHNSEIAERILPPSQRGKYGGERLLAMQAEALKEAAASLAYKLAPVVDWNEIKGYRIVAKVYGEEGHRQRASFGHSTFYNFGKKGFITRKVNVLKEDVLKTNDFAIIVCDGDTKKAVDQELSGQLSDGAFENCRKGKIETMFFGKI